MSVQSIMAIGPVIPVVIIENIDDKEVFKSNHDDHKTHSESSHINKKSHHKKNYIIFEKDSIKI